MERMDFDSVYSNLHVNKDTESAIGIDLVPKVTLTLTLTRVTSLTPHPSLLTFTLTLTPALALTLRSTLGASRAPSRYPTESSIASLPSEVTPPSRLKAVQSSLRSSPQHICSAPNPHPHPGVERAMLPSRSFMRIGAGPGRAIDF